MDHSKKIALVTGANKGLGFEIVKQLAEKGLTVLLTARDSAKGEKAAKELTAKGFDVVFCQMDVTKPQSIRAAADFVDKKFGRLDALVNNAGVMLENDLKKPAVDVDLDTVHATLETNVVGQLAVSQAFAPLLKKSGHGRIVNMSSGLGQLSDMGSGYTAYRISKTALNAITRILANELKGDGVLVNSMCPGWCRTDMGGPNADRSAEEGARTAAYLATLPDGGATGKIFRDKKEIAW